MKYERLEITVLQLIQDLANHKSSYVSGNNYKQFDYPVSTFIAMLIMTLVY
jgi:hypothetical protein